ncbi:MAG: hypothetical protein PUG48_00875 [Clostridia bacterium]|nr:hypothetical protein [Clostridia bacterium]
MKGLSRFILVMEVIFAVVALCGVFFAVMAIITEGWSMRLGVNIALFAVIIALNIIQLVIMKKQKQ